MKLLLYTILLLTFLQCNACQSTPTPSTIIDTAATISKNEYEGLSLFVNGYARVEKDGKSFYIDTLGQFVTDNYNNLPKNEKKAPKKITISGEGAANYLGNIEQPVKSLNKTFLLHERHDIKMIAEQVSNNNSGNNKGHFRYGYSSKAGTILIPVINEYYDQFPLKDDATGMPDYFSFYINPQYLLLSRFDKDSVFHVGLADHSGKTILEPNYLMLYFFDSDNEILFRQGGQYYQYKEKKISADNNISTISKYGIADEQGNIIVHPVIDQVAQTVMNYNDKLTGLTFPLLCRINDKWIYYTKSGKILPLNGSQIISFD